MVKLSSGPLHWIDDINTTETKIEVMIQSLTCCSTSLANLLAISRAAMSVIG